MQCTVATTRAPAVLIKLMQKGRDLENQEADKSMGQSLTENNFATVIVKKMKFLPSNMFSLALVANERA